MRRLASIPVGGVRRSPPARQEWRDADGELWAICRVEGDRRLLEMVDLGRFELDVRSGVVEGEALDGIEPARFDRRLWKEALPLLYQASGALCLHASAVRAGAGAVALLGPSMSGKSSLARAWSSRRGVEQLADDVVVLYPSAAGFALHPLPFYTNVKEPVASSLESPFLERRRGASPVPLAGLYFVRPVAAQEPALRRLRAAGLTDLLAESFCFLLEEEGAKRAFLSANLDLLERVPSQRLDYPHRLAALETTIELLEVDLAAAKRARKE